MARWVWLAVGLVGCSPLDEGGEDSAAAVFSTTGWDEAWAGLEDEVLALVNGKRAIGGRCGSDLYPRAAPLVMDATLRGLARDFSRRMAEEQFFDHVAPDGSDPFDRMTAAGFTGALPWGENIAAGHSTADEVVDAWMSSPGHCSNILSSEFGALGVGFYQRPDDPTHLSNYWTQEFAGSGQP